ncbi:MAG: hypothetical protein HY240_06315 [Actinobacteria bacterium]|nr:hypothetical protein [Actinomycetota bacterium]
MGEVVSLADHRARTAGLPAALERLDLAVRRLEPLVRGRGERLSRRLEADLLAIADDVSAGRPHLAARRAERLADRLEHPAALG